MYSPSLSSWSGRAKVASLILSIVGKFFRRSVAQITIAKEIRRKTLYYYISTPPPHSPTKMCAIAWHMRKNRRKTNCKSQKGPLEEQIYSRSSNRDCQRSLWSKNDSHYSRFNQQTKRIYQPQKNKKNFNIKIQIIYGTNTLDNSICVPISNDNFIFNHLSFNYDFIRKD